MKLIKDLIHKIKVISFSIKTIFRIDSMYLFLLGSSMIILMILPFLDIYLLRNVIYLVFEQKNIEASIYCLLIFVIAIVVLNSLKSLVMWYRSNHYVCFGHYFDIINSKKSLSIDYEKLQEKETQDIIIRAARGCSAVARVGEYASDIISNIVQMIGTIVIVISVCHWYGIVIIMLALFCYEIEKKANQIIYENENKSDAIERKRDYFLKTALDSRSGKEIRVFNAASLFKIKYENTERELYDLQCINNKVSFWGSVFKVLVISCESLLIYFLASKQYTLGKIGISEISLCVSSVSVFISAFNNLFSNFASVGLMEKRMDDFRKYQDIDMNSEKKKGKKKAYANDFVIEFKNVSFTYRNAEKECLHDINLKICKGDKIAIFGENGAGKTTFIKLLLGLYTPTKGEILFNGINYLNYDIKQYYNIFSTVFQDFVMFAYTIKENIIFDKVLDDKNEIYKIIENVGLKHKINNLSEGIDTYITQEYDAEGENLSGGECQRVAIARAWFKDGSIIVMDEPTSAIDPISEEKLFNSIAQFLDRKTAILISHRMSSVRLCNKVILFDNGTISEFGTHDELMKFGKKYYDLYNTQAKWYVSQEAK